MDPDTWCRNFGEYLYCTSLWNPARCLLVNQLTTTFDSPQAALHMLHRFVHGSEAVGQGNDNIRGPYLLSPLFPKNATLVSMTNKEFDEAMNAWTEQAMSAPYVTDQVPWIAFTEETKVASVDAWRQKKNENN